MRASIHGQIGITADLTDDDWSELSRNTHNTDVDWVVMAEDDQDDDLASEGGISVALGQPAGAATHGQSTKMPNVKIRNFDGNPKKYTEWKREVEAAEMLYKVPKEQLAGLVYLALLPGPGRPRDLLSHMDIR